MIQKINGLEQISIHSRKNKINKTQENPIQNIHPQTTELQGVPKGYITFRGKEEESNLELDADAIQLFNLAKEIAFENGHSEVTPYHILEAAIAESGEHLNLCFANENVDEAVLAYNPTLNKLANEQANVDLLENEETLDLYINSLNELRANNDIMLASLPKTENLDKEKIDFSKDMQVSLKKVQDETSHINAYSLLGVAFNTVTLGGTAYTSDFLKNVMKPKMYVNKSDLKDNYMKAYDAKAVDVWNKLALGSNLFILANNAKESDRLTSSIIKTVNAPKHGNFNNKNTSIHVMKNEIKANEMLDEAQRLLAKEPNKKIIMLANLDYLLLNSQNENSEMLLFSPELIQLANQENDRLKIVFFQNSESYYTTMQSPTNKKIFSKFITYSIPPMHSYEAQEFLSHNKKYLKDVQTPFTKDARDKAILYANNIEGIYPDKGIDFMKRIASYYGSDKKIISTKEVDEFADIAKDLFNKNTEGLNIVYDTGKNLQSLYGKDTTKKDVEALVKQIKSGKLGTKGLIIYAKDQEAGSGRRHTAQAIAGEAKVPFIEIDSSDFAKTEVDEDGERVSAKNLMNKVFSEAKKAAEQNEHKTAIIYINSFEEFAFSGPYLPGYKQAMAQLSKEMNNAENEKLNLLVIGSTDEYYTSAIPMMVKGFNQTLAIDSPAFNNKSRKEIITNRLAERNIKLTCKTPEEKEKFINSLVKMTSYMSFVEIKAMLEKAEQIMEERKKNKASLGEFIEAYLQLMTGRTSFPEMPEYNKRATTSHECGHATNLEIMEDIMRLKGKPWHQYMDVNFITLDPRGDFLGAVFQGQGENKDFPFEALFTSLVCAYGGYSCEKLFFDMDGSAGIGQDLAQATAATKRGIEQCGFGHYTGKISNIVQLNSPEYNANVYKDIEVILKNAQLASDLITETYRGFNEWFTNKYAKLIGSDNCMIDGDDFRKALHIWEKSQSIDKKEEISILQDMVMDIIKSCKEGKIYGQAKKLIK